MHVFLRYQFHHHHNHHHHYHHYQHHHHHHQTCCSPQGGVRSSRYCFPSCPVSAQLHPVFLATFSPPMSVYRPLNNFVVLTPSSSSHIRTTSICFLALCLSSAPHQHPALRICSFIILSLLVTPLIALMHFISATSILHRC